jgi:ketosteroid isomerase-like protein
MKKFAPLLACVVLFAACKDDQKTEQPSAETPVAKPTVTFPYTASYSSDFSIGDPDLTKKVLDMYKALESSQYDTLGTYYADTVNWRNFAEDDLVLPREKLIAKIRNFREQFRELSETPIAFTALHSNDRNDDWVITWIKEKVTYRNGKQDSTTYQECWRFRDGKVYMHDSYAKYKR